MKIRGNQANKRDENKSKSSKEMSIGKEKQKVRNQDNKRDENKKKSSNKRDENKRKTSK
jgi:hypothetical protein